MNLEYWDSKTDWDEELEDLLDLAGLIDRAEQ